MEKEVFSEKMKSVANILGYQWELKQEWSNNAGYLIGPNQAKIWVRNDEYVIKERIEFNPCYPETQKGRFGKVYQRYDEKGRMKITVSENKTPEQIARDIQKRFLPPYLEKLQKAVIHIQKIDEYETKKMACLKKVADYLGEDVATPSLKNPRIYSSSVKGLYVITADSNMMIRFEVEVTPEKAIEIIKILEEEE